MKMFLIKKNALKILFCSILIGGHSKCHSNPTLIKTGGRHHKHSDL
jgi:hypothetical protein